MASLGKFSPDAFIREINDTHVKPHSATTYRSASFEFIFECQKEINRCRWKLLASLFPRGCSLPNRVYGFYNPQKNPWIYWIFSDFSGCSDFFRFFYIFSDFHIFSDFFLFSQILWIFFGFFYFFGFFGSFGFFEILLGFTSILFLRSCLLPNKVVIF